MQNAWQAENKGGKLNLAFPFFLHTSGDNAQAKYMERAKEILSKMASPSLYCESKFVCGEVDGCILGSVNLIDSQSLLEILSVIKRAGRSVGSYEQLQHELLPSWECKVEYSPEPIMTALLGGDGLLYLDQIEGCLVLALRKYSVRSVSEPPTSGIIHGPREGYIEDIKTNLSLTQRKLKTPDLAVDRLTLGKRTGTAIAVVYINGLAESSLVSQILGRLRGIDIDGVMDTHYLQEFLDDRPRSIFTQSGVSEKPDIIAAKLLEGRIAIFVDGSPMVMTLPYLFIEELQSGEDYYDRSSYTSLLRVVRLLALFVGIVLPGLYVALQEFHLEVLPLSLLITIVVATEGVPFPPFGEVLFVLFLFEVLREAGVRMPQALGLAISVVGALVLGDTAVKAGFIGSTVVMIVALSSISLYTVPGISGTSALLRLIFTCVGGVAGLFGIMLTAMFLIVYLCSLENYGVPYLAPFAPMIAGDFKDGIVRSPLPEQKTRPKSIPNPNKNRQGNNPHER